jgi:hypothetical protein
MEHLSKIVSLLETIAIVKAKDHSGWDWVNRIEMESDAGGSHL